MKSKRIISGLLALTFVFGGIVVPSNVVNNSSIISASAGSGDFTYSLLNDGTYEIYDISTNLRNNVTHVVIPSEFNGKEVTSISKSVFNQCNFTSVEIPNTITKISYNSFYGCENLKSIVLPESITEIEDCAFQNCKSLESVTLNEGLEKIGAKAFQDCESLKSIEIPSSVGRIGDFAFYNYNSKYPTLAELHISGGGTQLKIGQWAFVGCSGLKDINIPDRVVDIGNYAFEYCTGLESISLPDSLKDLGYCAFMGCSNLKNVNIPKSLKAIPQSTFSECIKLTNITIPDNIEEIGSCAFRDCTGFTNFTIPDNITKIGSSAFSGCTGLTNIKIPDNIKEIESSTFSGCTGLTNIKIPDNITKIGSSAFSGCTGLTNFTIPDTIKKIEISTFNGCTKLTNVFIPEGVTAIDKYAFCGCTGLKYIWIPASVESIGDYAFSTEYKGEPLKNVTIFCYPNVSSCALEYAKAKGLKYQVIDKIRTYPTGIGYRYNEKYRQVQITWDPVARAERYAIAVYISGKWRMQTQNIPASTTSYVTPKNSIIPSSTYKVAVAARVDGKWDTINPMKNYLTINIYLDNKEFVDKDWDGIPDDKDPLKDVPLTDEVVDIDDHLINDDRIMERIKPRFDEYDLENLSLKHGTIRPVDLDGGPISSEIPDIPAKNELIYTRVRGSVAKFSITPISNSDYAFTIKNTKETKTGEKYNPEEYNPADYVSDVEVHLKGQGRYRIKPVDIKINDSGKEITYVFALEKGKEYNIYVVNDSPVSSLHERPYEIHVSEDNWVYAKYGGIRNIEEYDTDTYDYYETVFLSDEAFYIMLLAYEAEIKNYTYDELMEMNEKEKFLKNDLKSCGANLDHIKEMLNNFDDYAKKVSIIDGYNPVGDLLTAAGIGVAIIPKFAAASNPIGITLSAVGLANSGYNQLTEYMIKKYNQEIYTAMSEGNYNISLTNHYHSGFYADNTESVEIWENNYINKYMDGKRGDVTPFSAQKIYVDGDTFKCTPLF